MSTAAARGAARSELFRAHHCSHFASQNSPVGSVDTADRTRRGEWSRWLSLPHRPREVNRRVAGHVGPEKLFATPTPPLLPRGKQDAAAFAPEAPEVGCAVRARRKRRGGRTRGSPQTATRQVALAAHVSVRGMAEASRLTVGGRVARLRAYGLGDTRGASGASPKSPLRFRRRPNRDLSQRFAGDLKGIKASRPGNPG